MIRAQTVIEGMVIYNTHPNYTQMKKLSKYLGTDKINNNGKLTVKCRKRVNLAKARKRICEIIGAKITDINLTYFETKW